jgi:hypothetical protein
MSMLEFSSILMLLCRDALDFSLFIVLCVVPIFGDVLSLHCGLKNHVWDCQEMQKNPIKEWGENRTRNNVKHVDIGSKLSIFLVGIISIYVRCVL